MTRSPIVILLLVIALTVPAFAKKKKDPQISQLFCQARFAYVRAFDGDIDNPYLYPDDRNVAEDLQQQLLDWHRYTLVLNPHEADLVFIVRAGRLGSVGTGPYPGGGPGAPGQVPPNVQARVPIGGGPASQGPYPNQNPNRNPGQNTPGSGTGYPGGPYGTTPAGTDQAGAEVGPPNDWMAIYSKSWDEQMHATPLFEKSKKDGLQGHMPLFLEIRNAVDAECPAPGKPAARSPKGK